MLFLLLLSSQIYSQTSYFTDVKEINEVQLKGLIEKRNDKYLLINVWATWCIPCREEFPDLVKLNKKYKKNFDFIGLSTDYKEDIKNKILPFIEEKKVDFPIYVNGFKRDEDLINLLNKNWSGSLPATFIYDQSGKQVKTFEGKQSFQTFDDTMNSLLKK